MNWRTSVFLPAIFVMTSIVAHAGGDVAPLTAPAVPNCGTDLAPSSPRLKRSDIAEFSKQLKKTIWPKMIGLAISFIKDRAYEKPFDRAVDFRKLLLVITKAYGRGPGLTWNFRTMWGTDHSIAFVGEEGYAIVFDQSGQVFKGRLDSKVYNQWSPIWPLTYGALKLLPELSLKLPAEGSPR